MRRRHLSQIVRLSLHHLEFHDRTLDLASNQMCNMASYHKSATGSEVEMCKRMCSVEVKWPELNVVFSVQ